MEFIPTIMMLRYHGIRNFFLRDISPIIKDKPKSNNSKERDVYVVGDHAYKIFHNDAAYHVLKNVNSGVYQYTSPQLEGIIFDYETPVGYVCRKCRLHMNPKDQAKAREMLLEAFIETGYVLRDFHIQNFGRLYGRVCLLDLEAIDVFTPEFKSKDTKYSRWIHKLSGLLEL